MTFIFSVTHSRTYSIRRAPEQTHELWMAALKGFEGPVHYIGSEGDFSYFRYGKLFTRYFKARTTTIRLPQTFDLDKGTSYPVTHEMVWSPSN